MDWLLLRGLTREQAHWGDFPRRLEVRFPHHRFFCADLTGTGLQAGLTSPSTIAGIRQQLQASLALTRPVGLLGLSMGGMVALDWAQQDPDSVAGLVLINTSTGFSPPWRRMRPGALSAGAGLLAREPDQRERAILALTSNKPVAPDLWQTWVQIQSQRPVRTSTMVSQLLAAARYRPRATPPPVPAWLLASRGDRIVHWHCSRTLAQRWSWPLWLHPDAGHDLPMDDPGWLLDRLADCLA